MSERLPRLTREQRAEALEKARAARLERLARGEREPIDDWPEPPPPEDEEGTARYNEAFRQWHEKHIGPWPEARRQRGARP